MSYIEIEQLNATKDKLLSIMGHDLRSPFNNILGFSELLINDTDNIKASEQKEYLHIINTTAEKTLILLDDLLYWAKSQTGDNNFNPEKVVCSSIIKEIIELSDPSAKNKNISINYIQHEETTFFADLNMLKTILRNLISNAIKFTNPNGKIDIVELKKDRFIEIAVYDNGIGMDEETQSKLFLNKTNRSTTGTANEKGSGLGLVLCKEFVDIHNGKIIVKSKLGKGSVFKIELPLEKM